MPMLQLEVISDSQALAAAAAKFLATEAVADVAARGRFVLAVSGGHNPWEMYRALASESLPWQKVYVVQVDERVAPAGDPDRNLTPHPELNRCVPESRNEYWQKISRAIRRPGS